MAVEYVLGTGRRKSSVARIRICRGTGKVLVNGRTMKEYFPTEVQATHALSPGKLLGVLDQWDIFVNVRGGGFTGQAGAIRHGLARALTKTIPPENRQLREAGFLTRDARVSERKKYGRAGARRGFQFSKR